MSADFCASDGSTGLNVEEGSAEGNVDVTTRLRPPSALAKKNKTGVESDKSRRVSFPEDNKLVTGYLEPVKPWQSVAEISSEELIQHYVQSCRKHKAEPLQSLVEQLKEWPFYGGSRRGVLKLSSAPLRPPACEALEAVLRRARFNRIELCSVSLTDETAVTMFDMMEYYESAAELDISGNKEFGILGWQACSRMVNKSQWLEQLEARETSLSESTAPVLGRALRPACVLRCLHLQRSRLAGRPLLCLASALKQNKSVRELHLGDNQLLPEDALHLAALLRCNSWLQLLDVSNNDIQDAGIEALAEALADQSNINSPSSSSSSESTVSSPQSASSASYQEKGLAVLVVWNNNLTRNSGQHFSKALSRCRSLEVLNMGQNPLGGETINRLRAALQQNRSLLCLGVQGARLGPEAAVALAEVIEDNPTLQRIDLRDNRLQVAGLLALATALRKNLAITRLDLDNAPPQTNGLDQPLEEARLVEEIRSLCQRNETQSLQSPSSPSSDDTPQRRRVASFSTRKISLTCQTLNRTYEHPPITEPMLSPPKGSSGRLRSPLPSPVPSPASSPIPSPSHRSRFLVSRVSDSPSLTSDSPSPSTPPGSRTFFSHPRFKVVSVNEPPTISVQGPDDGKPAKETVLHSPMINVSSQTESDSPSPQTVKNSRFSVVRNVNIGRGKNKKCCDEKREDTSVRRNITKELMKPADEVQPMVTSDTVKMDEIDNNKENVLKVGDSEETIEGVKSSLTSCTEEGKDSSAKVSLLKRRMSDITKNDDDVKQVSGSIKKNKSESSLDSPDLEVSRLMQGQSKNVYDSNSSLDISGSSMESLNTLEVETKKSESTVLPMETEEPSRVIFSLQDEPDSFEVEQDVFPVHDSKNPFIYPVSEGNPFKSHGKKLANLSASSNESSLESSTFEAGVIVNLPQHPQNHGNLLNSSVSSNESVSPNIFGKHMKLHGSVTSLEASVSSLDSYRSGNTNAFTSPTTYSQNPSTFTFPSSNDNQMIDSLDSGIGQSDTKARNPSFNESFSSNEGTLTSNSNLKSSIFSMGGESSLSIESDNEKSPPMESVVPHVELTPRRVTSLLDVPSMQKQRSRKISWVAPSNFHANQQMQPQQPTRKEVDEPMPQTSKVPSSLEKLLSLFQHPGSIFSRGSDSTEKRSNDSSQSSSRRDSQSSMGGSSGSFWSWGLGTSGSTANKSSCDNKSVGPIERLKKYGESFETALQFGDSDSKSSVVKTTSKSDISGSTNVVEKMDTDIGTENKSSNMSRDSDSTITDVRQDAFDDLDVSESTSIKVGISRNASKDSEHEDDLSFEHDVQMSDEATPSFLRKYSLDSEYVKQTINSVCVLHSFKTSQVTADYTFVLGDHRESSHEICTCDNQLKDTMDPCEDVLQSNSAFVENTNTVIVPQEDVIVTDITDEELSSLYDNNKATSAVKKDGLIVSIPVEDVPVCDDTIFRNDESFDPAVFVRLTQASSTRNPVFDTTTLNVTDKRLDSSLAFKDEGIDVRLAGFTSDIQMGNIDNRNKDDIEISQQANETDISNLKTVPVCSVKEVLDSEQSRVAVSGTNSNKITAEVSSGQSEILVVPDDTNTVPVENVRLNDTVSPNVEGDLKYVDVDRVTDSTNDTEKSTNSVVYETKYNIREKLKGLNIISDSEKEDILEIVKNICEEAVKVVSKSEIALKSYENCDKLAEMNDTGCVNRGDDSTVPDSGNGSRTNIGNPIRQVQNDLVLSICDNNTLGMNDNCIINVINEAAVFNSDNVVRDSTDDSNITDLISDDDACLAKDDCVTNESVSDENKCDKEIRLNICDGKREDIICESETVIDLAKVLDDNLIIDQTKREITRPTDLQVRIAGSTIPCVPKQLTYSSVLKQSIGLDNKTPPGDRQASPESGPSVENLPSKIIRRIKENISPENTLTSSMTNTKALAQELMERRNVLGANTAIWEIGLKENVDKIESKLTDETICRFYDKLLGEPFDEIDRIEEKMALKSVDDSVNVKNHSVKDKNSNSDNLAKELSLDDKNSNTTITVQCADEESIKDLEKPVDTVVIVDADSNENNSDIVNASSFVEMNNTFDLHDVDQGSDALTIFDLNSDDLTTETYDTISIIGEDIVACIDNLPMQSVKQSALTVDENADEIQLSVDNLDSSLIKNAPVERCSPNETSQNSIASNRDELNSSFVDTNLSLNEPIPVVGIEEIPVPSELLLNVLDSAKSTDNRDYPSIAIDVASEIICKDPDSLNVTAGVKNIFDDAALSEVKDEFKPVSILKRATPVSSKTVSLPQDIPEPQKPFQCYGYTHPIPSKKSSDSRRSVPVRCGSLPENSSSSAGSPKSLPEALNLQSRRSKSRSPVNSLGKLARDSLYALNMTEEEMQEFRESGKLASLESVKSLGSVSEDIEDLSSNYICQSSSDSKSLEPGVSQDSLASLGSISENASEGEGFAGVKFFETI